jgi:hypothetical protein
VSEGDRPTNTDYLRPENSHGEKSLKSAVFDVFCAFLGIMGLFRPRLQHREPFLDLFDGGIVFERLRDPFGSVCRRYLYKKAFSEVLTNGSRKRSLT